MYKFGWIWQNAVASLSPGLYEKFNESILKDQCFSFMSPNRSIVKVGIMKLSTGQLHPWDERIGIEKMKG